MEVTLLSIAVLFPALAFLLAGVPLAVLLDKLGFFRAAANIFLRRRPSVFALWMLAAVTTAVLNLDTTIVLLTPLYVQIANRLGVDPFPLVTIPLFLASFASSLLPVSNLTNLIAANTLHLSMVSFLAYLGLPTVVAVLVGWFFYRRMFPEPLPLSPLDTTIDKKALSVGCLVVGLLLLGFFFGPLIHMQAWMVVLLMDLFLILFTQSFPWKSIPLITALGILGLALVIALVIPKGLVSHILPSYGLLVQMSLAALYATVGANTVNNLPTTLIGVHGGMPSQWILWAWLIGVNVGAMLLPIGAIANLLWIRILKQQNIAISFRRYISLTFPVGLPTLLITFLVLVLEYVWFLFR